MRLSWSVATYDDLTPSAASSGCLGPVFWLGVTDAFKGLKTWTVFESRKLVLEVCDSNRFDVWDISSEDIFLMTVNWLRGLMWMLSAQAKLIVFEDGSFP